MGMNELVKLQPKLCTNKNQGQNKAAFLKAKAQRPIYVHLHVMHVEVGIKAVFSASFITSESCMHGKTIYVSEGPQVNP